MPRGENFRGARPPGSGRKRGTPNQTTRDFREIVQRIIDENAENLGRWIAEVAEGKPAQIIDADPSTGRPAGVVPGVEPNPARAIALVAALAQFVAAKQTRQADEGSVQEVRPVLNVTIGGRPAFPQLR